MFTIKTTITKDLKELRESQSNFLLSQVSNKVRTNDGLYYWGIRAKVLGNVPLIPPADYTYKSCVGTKSVVCRAPNLYSLSLHLQPCCLGAINTRAF